MNYFLQTAARISIAGVMLGFTNLVAAYGAIADSEDDHRAIAIFTDAKTQAAADKAAMVLCSRNAGMLGMGSGDHRCHVVARFHRETACAATGESGKTGTNGWSISEPSDGAMKNIVGKAGLPQPMPPAYFRALDKCQSVSTGECQEPRGVPGCFPDEKDLTVY